MRTQNKRYGSFGDIESFRYSYQQMIDSKKNVDDRRKLGQLLHHTILHKKLRSSVFR